MVQLNDTAYGYKQRLLIGGINSWNVFSKTLMVTFFIEILDQNDVKVVDKTIHQDREVSYELSNINRVDGQFNPVESGGSGEYDYFLQASTTIPIPTLVGTLADKLAARGVFN